MQVQKVHIGQKIHERIKELRITKTEFGKRIGVQQQHVNRLLERPSIDTEKLAEISVALDFNFFVHYCPISTLISAYQSAIAQGAGSAYNLLGDPALAARVAHLEETNNLLKSQLADKERIIALMDKDKE